MKILKQIKKTIKYALNSKKLGWAKCSNKNARLYIQKCELFSNNEQAFKNFKRDKDYGKILESGAEIVGIMALDSIKKFNGTNLLLENLNKFKENDIYGNPNLINFNYQNDGFNHKLGLISSSTLRYINTCVEIREIIGNDAIRKIVEVGGGYGGLCKMMSVLHDFDEYIIIDLPSVIKLCKKYIDHFENIKYKVKYISCNDIESLEKIKEIDLFISDSALAECDFETQKKYTKNIAKRAIFIYVTWNTLHVNGSAYEMMKFLKNFNQNNTYIYEQDSVLRITVNNLKKHARPFP